MLTERHTSGPITTKTRAIDAPTSLDPPSDPRSNAELIRESVDQARELIRIEVALAKNEAMRDLTRVKGVAISGVIAGVAALIGVTMLLVALALVIHLGALVPFIFGCALVAIAIVAGIIAYIELPQRPLGRTKSRLFEHTRLLKERVA